MKLTENDTVCFAKDIMEEIKGCSFEAILNNKGSVSENVNQLQTFLIKTIKFMKASQKDVQTLLNFTLKTKSS